MSAANIMKTYQAKANQFQFFLKLSKSFLQKNNPITGFYLNIVSSIKEVLTANKKLKIARYRVNHLRYRLYQMDNLIQTNNPYNLNSGKKIDFLR